MSKMVSEEKSALISQSQPLTNGSIESDDAAARVIELQEQLEQSQNDAQTNAQRFKDVSSR